MSLEASVQISLSSVLQSALDLTTSKDTLSYKKTNTFTNGTGANQVNNQFHDQRTLAVSTAEELDLAGSLLDAFGNTITFTKIKGIIVYAAAANTNDVRIGGSAANGFNSWVGAVGDYVKVKPGGLFLLTAPDATGLAVTAGTGDLLTLENDSSGTAVTYDIVLLGVE
ncbi:MAG: hypothetical protein ABUJ92_00405 [Desulfobacterales bacterium]